MTRRTLENVVVRDVEKRRSPSKHYAFIMEVTWSDGLKSIIGRHYSCFFDLQLSLLERFPKESGMFDPRARIIPFIPGKIFFGRSNTREVALKRMRPLSTYCMSLLKLPEHISKDTIVLDFFETGIEDNGITLGGNSSSSDKSPGKTANEITGPLILEKYVAIAAYKKDNRKELDLKEGEVVEVVEKRESGWWLVANEEEKNGWVPGVYLEELYGNADTSIAKERVKAGEGQKYTSLYGYNTDNTTDELSFPAGCEIEILEKNLEGWWFGRINGKEGWVPASYLEETRIKKMEGAEARRNFGIGRQRTIKEDRPPPKKTSFKRTLTKAQVAKVRAQYIIKQQSIDEFDERDEEIAGIYKAISDFTSTNEDGISFQKDQILEVLQKSDSGWWFAKIGDRQGWVPEAYLVEANTKSRISPVPKNLVISSKSEPLPDQRSPKLMPRQNHFGSGNSPLLSPISPALPGKPQRPPSPRVSPRSPGLTRKSLPSISPGGEISNSAFTVPSSFNFRTHGNHLHGSQSDVSPKRYSNPDPTPEPIPVPRLPARNSSPSPRKPSRALAAYDWYKDISRQEAEEALQYAEEEGFFIVRPSRRGSSHGKPYSLTMFHKGITWNFHIRRRTMDGLFAVGAYKEDEPCFVTVAELIKYYEKNHMVIGEQENLVRLLGTPQDFYDKC